MWRMMTEAGIVNLINDDVESGTITTNLVADKGAQDLDLSKI
jgi:hypothetical protein